MDPVSQAVVGATIASTSANRRTMPSVIAVGALAGMAADLDVLISSNNDPLLFLEYHRQFTHALLFAPLGALLVSVVLHPFFKRQLTYRQVLVACLLGYASHGLLDACTTYGTQLLWPLTDHRFAWHTISIIDPLFTLPLVTALILAMTRWRPVLVQRFALIWLCGYLGLGEFQRQRAMTAGLDLAASRGHLPTRLEAKPGFAQLLLWKTVYEWDGAFYVDGVRAGYDIQIYQGASIPKIDHVWADQQLPAGSQLRKDFDRFRWFSNDYLALDPQRPNFIVDVRYSMNVHEIRPLWGIAFDQNIPEDHVDYQTNRRADAQTLDRFWRMLLGRPLDPPVPSNSESDSQHEGAPHGV